MGLGRARRTYSYSHLFICDFPWNITQNRSSGENISERRALGPPPGLKNDGKICIGDDALNGMREIKLGDGGQLGSRPSRCRAEKTSSSVINVNVASCSLS